MIYTVAEWIATIVESIILFWFLVCTLSYKEISTPKKYIGTIIFIVLLNTMIFTFNYFYIIEGWLALFYILLLFLFCQLLLKQKIWYQGIAILLSFTCIYVINLLVTLCGSAVLQISSDEILALRNPVRIFMLFITKSLLFISLYFLSFLFRKRKILFSNAQGVVMLFMLSVTLFAGAVLEKIQLDNYIRNWETVVITICLIAINCLMFLVMYLFSVQNRIKMNSTLLKMEMQNEREKLEETILWNSKVQTLQHDLKNHLFCISEFIKEQQIERALQYIGKISYDVQKEFPNHSLTNHPALNAILDLKKLICIENKIDLKCFILEEMPEFDDVDLCIVLSNLFDNAIEAEKKEQNPEIWLSVSVVGNYLRIVMKNRTSSSVLEKNKKLQTSKKDQKLHGFGIMSISETVQKNDGMQEFYEEDGWFIANVLLKLQISL